MRQRQEHQNWGNAEQTNAGSKEIGGWQGRDQDMVDTASVSD